MYRIIPDDAPCEMMEQAGTKEKYWFRLEDQFCLFKVGRAGTGENWAEKVAGELCAVLGLPSAHYDFAAWKQKKGVLSPTFLADDDRLVMGNELLAEIHTNYPLREVRKVKDHTLGRIHALLNKNQPPLDWDASHTAISNAFDVFVGYVMLDAWIANQDRHHENWGVINRRGGTYLAPTYDHAASLGRNETNKNREDRLKTRDSARHITSYVTKARSAIYRRKTDDKPLPTIDVFFLAQKKRPEAARYWLNRLELITQRDCKNIFRKIPSTEIDRIAIQFALKLLEINKNRLLAGETMP